MVNTCVYKGCINNSRKNKDVQYFRFPKNSQMLLKWIDQINPDIKPQPTFSRICSDHFETSMIIQRGVRKVLSPDAYPKFYKDFLHSASSVDANAIIDPISLENICRACESPDVAMDLAKPENYNLLLKFRACVKFEVDILDPLPNQLCAGCVNSIESFYRFKIKCESIDKKFRDFILTTSVEEPNQLQFTTHKNNMNEEDQEPGAKPDIENVTIFCDVNQLIDENEVMPKQEILDDSVSMCSLTYKEDMADNVLDIETEVKIEKYEEHSNDFVQEEGKHKLLKNTPSAKSSARSLKKKRTTTNKGEAAKRNKRNIIYECETCHETFSKAIPLREHIKLHGENRYKCETCDRWFLKRFKYTEHMKTHSSDYQKTQFVCNICSVACSTLPNLRRHQVCHNKDLSFECDVCHKRYQSSERLKLHKTCHFPKELKRYGKNPFECEFCHKRFTTRAVLNTHLLVHTGEKPHQCERCGMIFRQKGHLNTHMLQHTGERNFVCNICSKSFVEKGNLTVHMRLHTGETPYKCKYCPLEFTSSNGLKRHSRIHVQNQDSIMVQDVDEKSSLAANVVYETAEEFFAGEMLANEIKNNSDSICV